MVKFKSFFAGLLVLFIALAILSGPVAAQDSPGKPPIDPLEIPFAGDAAESLRTPQLTGALDDWSMLAFQRFLNDNWDIWVQDKDGSRRLTTSPATDRHVSLDRGAKRVAFTSNRDGDYDLYTQNVDGSALVRIVDTAEEIGFPAWSPDGRRIAFQSKINDQYEIYLVDADGSNSQRLTHDDAFDGQPAWSPDGKQLAFSSDRSGDYRIYLMNADGSGITQLTTLPLSLHPTWLPDGRYLAFDADVDGDTWQELAIIQSNGTEEHMVYNPGSSATAWAGRWSPDGHMLSFTEVTLAIQDGVWVWTSGVIRAWNATTGYGFSDLVAGGKEWRNDWETKDTTAPETTINPLPPFSPAAGFTLKWIGVDEGGSGIKSYRIYFKEAYQSTWRVFLGHTLANEIPFPAEAGKTIDFLVHAEDNAYNKDPFEQQKTVRTTFYNTKLSGKLFDNRATPLSDVPLNIEPLTLFPLVTNEQGQYTGYTVKQQEHKFSIQEPNFMPLPNTTAAAGSDFLRDMVLMPADTVVQNGTFEYSGSVPTFWSLGGTLPVLITGVEAATGRYALHLGLEPQNVSPASANVAGTASIAQTVTIPAAMLDPTLSFMGKAINDQSGDVSELRVLIQPQGPAGPTEFKQSLTNTWSLRWLDMSPWLGQQVTVTFELIQVEGDPPLTVYLDDISLGSASPELWISMQPTPAKALPGQAVTLTINHGNRGAIKAAPGRVDLALPTSLTLVSATPPGTLIGNILRWDTAEWPAHSGPQTITVQATLNSAAQNPLNVKATIDSVTPEAHIGNNTASVLIGVGTELFMPLVVQP